MKSVCKIFLCATALAAAVALPLGAAAQGLAARVVADDYSHLQLSVEVDGVRGGEAVVCGSLFGTLEVDGCAGSNAVGQPALPVARWLIEVPLCEAFEVVVSDAVFDTVDAQSLGLNGLLAPVQPDRRKSDTTRTQLAMDEATYAADAYYALPLAEVEEVGIARDRRLARLTISPLGYNPVKGRVVVCRSARVDIRYHAADADGTKQLFQRYHTPAFGIGAETLNSLYPKSVSSAAPVRYTIVAHSMFRGALDTFVAWKERKGFLVDVAYTDDPLVGNTTTSIAAWLAAQYAGASDVPAPTYVLLVGDVAQIPAFTGQTDSVHVTDLYYSTWTAGDNIPDCYYGRFSASSLSQLQPQIDKTLMYEQYAFSDPTFLDRVILVAGVDGGNAGDYGYTHADPTMDYAATNYFNQNRSFSDVRYFKNDLTTVPGVPGLTVGSSAGNNADAVRATYNLGASLINYSAHGSPTCWGTPYFSVDHVAQMSNHERFGLMIGNCCQSNQFNDAVCLGEALLRRGDYCGAVGYIGGSNSTYWGSDFYWAVGVRGSISATMSLGYNSSRLGAYDRICHTHNENHSKWAESQGSIIMAGNMAVQSGSGGNTAHYYWEIYHLMGDPSLMPYLTQAYEMSVSVDRVVAAGCNSLHVETVPYAYVALTNTTGVVAAAFANGNGEANLALGSLAEGEYELAVSAQQYRQAFVPVRAVAVDGPCVVVNDIELDGDLDAGATRRGMLTLNNMGDAAANGVVLYFASDNAHLQLLRDSLVVGTVPAHSTVVLSGLTMAVSPLATDGERATVTVGTTQYASSFGCTLNAPNVRLEYFAATTVIQQGESDTVVVRLTNLGKAMLTADDLRLQPQTALMTATATDGGPFALPYGQSIVRSFVVHASDSLPLGAAVDVHPALVSPSTDVSLGNALTIKVGERLVETFTSETFHTSGWQQGSHEWIMTTDSVDATNTCLRSEKNLGHNQTSEITLTCQISEADSIAFRYVVSSENGYDKFHFIMDGTELMEASGEVGWTTVAYAVPAGNHTFTFRYSKDYSENRGRDCAMIDDVALPFAARNVTFRTDHVCQGAAYAPFGQSIATQEAGHGTTMSADSMTVVDYVIHGSTTVADTIVACDRYIDDGTMYMQSTDMTLVLVDQYGCDSTVALHLSIGKTTKDTLRVNNDGGYIWNGEFFVDEGVYVRYMESQDGCDSVVVLIIGNAESVVAADGVRLTLYPNPTTSTVAFDAMVDRVEVYDVAGRMVAACDMTDVVDLSGLSQGVYLLRLKVGKNLTTCRVQKK